ncbi:ABC transporter permease, partial [bacterium]|nr:ABC transporter permease [bacterium]
MELLNKIYKDKFTFVALLILCFLYVIILFADFIAPYSNYYSNRDLSYAPPSKVYTITQEGKLSLPYTYNYVREFEPSLMQTIYKQDRSQKHYLKLFVRGEEYKILGLIPCNIHLFGAENGGQIHLLGTDINGRDVFSRLLFGGRISMTVGFLSLFIVFPIGLLYGGISGY